MSKRRATTADKILFFQTRIVDCPKRKPGPPMTTQRSEGYAEWLNAHQRRSSVNELPDSIISVAVRQDMLDHLLCP